MPSQAPLAWLHQLDTVDNLRKLFAKFIDDHNALIPRVALKGRTPDEVFFGARADVADKLSAARAQARVDRVAYNQALPSCRGCDGPSQPTSREDVVDRR